jgi:hypothetical protein
MFDLIGKSVVLTTVTVLAGIALGAEPAPSDRSPTLSSTEKGEVIAALEQQIRKNYVFPEVAEQVIAALDQRSAGGHYAGAATAKALARLLTVDLRQAGNDLHFNVAFDPEFIAPSGEDAIPSDAEVAQMRRIVVERAGGISQVRRLPGNIAYMEMREFFPIEHAAAYFDAAMALSGDSNALILDLRRNGGGDPNMVTYVMSHFFAIGDERHLNDLYFRPKNQTREFWTIGSVSPRYLKPVYVLVSDRTFSGAEECAYDFQTQRRASVIGVSTGGGANPGDVMQIGHGLVAFIPNGRAINPVTHTNWEHVGVKPDIQVPAADALLRAYSESLENAVAATKDPDEHDALTRILARARKGEIDPVDYTPQAQAHADS